QEEITRHGHAIEVRVYAEDPDSGFLPSVGRIGTWRLPSAAEGVRIDSGFREGDQVTPHYDPMLAKLIVHGADRAHAMDRLQEALSGFLVTGVKTNLGFLQALVRHPDIRAGEMDTSFIERNLPALLAEAGDAASIGDQAA